MHGDPGRVRRGWPGAQRRLGVLVRARAMDAVIGSRRGNGVHARQVPSVDGGAEPRRSKPRTMDQGAGSMRAQLCVHRGRASVFRRVHRYQRARQFSRRRQRVPHRERRGTREVARGGVRPG